jgi:hypothetical protein
VSRACPYKKLLLCLLPPYVSEERTEYIQQLRNALREALENSRDITVELSSTIEGIHHIPNQMLLHVLFGELQKVKQATKVCMIAPETRMMSLYKFELLKT